jgi:hypothetical protein
MEQTFELNDIYVQGAKFPAFLFFKTFGQPQNGMLEAYAELFTPFNNEKNEKTSWWNGNTQLPETALIPVIMKDVPTINQILSSFQFGGHLAGVQLSLKTTEEE